MACGLHLVAVVLEPKRLRDLLLSSVNPGFVLVARPQRVKQSIDDRIFDVSFMPPPRSAAPTRCSQIQVLRHPKRTTAWKKRKCLQPEDEAHVLPPANATSCCDSADATKLLQYRKQIVPGSSEVVYVVPDSEDEDADIVSDSSAQEVYIVPNSEDEDLDIQPNSRVVQREKAPQALDLQVENPPDFSVVQVDKDTKSDPVKSMLTPEQVRAFYEKCNGDVVKFMFGLMQPKFYVSSVVRDVL